MIEIKSVLDYVRQKKLYPWIPTLEDDVSNNPEFTIGGKKYLTFNSCNYLGLSDYQPLKQIISEEFLKSGIHPSNSPLVGGIWKTHRIFEKKVANFFGYEDAMLFTSTTMTNMGVIPAVCNLPAVKFLSFLKNVFRSTEMTVFSDEDNHATVIEGVRLSNVKKIVYKHLDLSDLESKLKKCKTRRKMILTDGIFSMDGRLAPVKEIIMLAKKYKALLYIDDAHSLGVLGREGQGILEHFNIRGGRIFLSPVFLKDSVLLVLLYVDLGI